jgi:hypothetical protein
MHLSTFSCFFFFIFNRLAAALSSWLIACFTLIRFLHIFRQFNTIRSNLLLLNWLTILFLFANSYVLIVLQYESISNLSSIDNQTTMYPQTSCHIRARYANDQLTLLLNALVAGVLSLALPSILILIVNLMMLCFIERVYNHQRQERIQRRSDIVNYRSTRSTLLVISMTYTICYLPYCVFYFLMIVMEDINDIVHYWSEITYILRHVSHSVNFYAYIFTSLRFRRDIVLLGRFFSRPYHFLQQWHRSSKSRAIIIENFPLSPPSPFVHQRT